VIVKESPFNTLRCVEALRMGLGLTLTENSVKLLFLEDGLFCLSPLRAEVIRRPGMEEFFKYCQQLSIPLLADQEGLSRLKLEPIRSGVKVVSHEEALSEISEAGVVIPF
jgi:sulfur relay (sulfurtransferase) DsrF/TusC family protein